MAVIRDQIVGDIFFRNIDEGIITTLNGVIVGSDYYLPLDKVSGVDPPLFTDYAEQTGDVGQPMPGIPFIFNSPGDEVQRYVIPCIRITREDPSPALERWGSLEDKYRAPPPGSSQINVDYRGTIISGYSKYQMQPGGWPYDIPYTISIEANGKRARTNAQIMLKHCMKIFGPYSVLTLNDDLGDERKYNVFVEGPSQLTAVSDMRERTIIHALSLRVAIELDVKPTTEHTPMTSEPTISTNMKE